MNNKYALLSQKEKRAKLRELRTGINNHHGSHEDYDGNLATYGDIFYELIGKY